MYYRGCSVCGLARKFLKVLLICGSAEPRKKVIRSFIHLVVPREKPLTISFQTANVLCPARESFRQILNKITVLPSPPLLSPRLPKDFPVVVDIFSFYDTRQSFLFHVAPQCDVQRAFQALYPFNSVHHYGVINIVSRFRPPSRQ